MAKQHKTLVVHAAPGHPAHGEPAASASADALTALLDDGWRLVSATAMGGAGGATQPVQFAALVILEREDKKTVGGFSST